MNWGKVYILLFLDELEESEFTLKGFSHYIQKPVGKKFFNKLITELNI